MDLKIAARMIAVFAIGAGLTAAITALRSEDSPEAAPSLRLRDPGGEPSLARCRDMGTAALEDAACRKAWAENRRRFLGKVKPDRPAVPKRSGDGPASPGTPIEEPLTMKDEHRLRPNALDDAEPNTRKVPAL